METSYANIVFLQGEEAKECLDMYRKGDIEGAIGYMKMWDYGDYHDVRDEPNHNNGGSLYEDGDYIACFNIGMDYCGLETKIVYH